MYFHVYFHTFKQAQSQLASISPYICQVLNPLCDMQIQIPPSSIFRFDI